MNFKELIGDYLDDATAHLSVFDSTLIALEEKGLDKELIKDCLGALHTMKGNSGMMGFEQLKNYIHTIEDLMKKLYDGELRLESVLDELFESANVIREVLHDIEKEGDLKRELKEEIERLHKVIEGDSNGSHNLKRDIDLAMYLGTKTDSIKVDFRRLDNLLNLAGELIIARTRLNQVADRIKGSIGSKSLRNEFKESLELIGKAVSSIQEGIMRVRMLPIGYVFHKYHRMVRDLSRQLGKRVQLVIEGDDTEVDKTVVDEIEEPLLHIIRNALDHGIEGPEERQRKGKNPQGTIILSAVCESNYIIITVQDDGRGIDFEKVKEKGIKKGLIKDGERIDRETLNSLLFSPGFTTKDETTEVSGRGIGLDVVSRNISRLNGFIIVDSHPDRGTTFRIKLPLSLAIIPALMVETEGEVYALPMSAVDESIRVKGEDIHYINNREIVQFRDGILPVIRLNEFFGLRRRNLKRFYLVIVGRSDNKRLAVAVDRLRGQQDIVIKPLDDTIGKAYGIAGASILGDGRIVLIVDTMSLFRKGET
jgi:two-component system chemotaxis sensor kinase CheA